MTTDLTIRSHADIDAVNEAIAAMDPLERDANIQPWQDYDGEEVADLNGEDFIVLLASGELVRWTNRDRAWEAMADADVAELRDEAREHGDEEMVVLCDLVLSTEFVVLGEGVDGIYPVDTDDQRDAVEALLAELGAESTPVYRGSPLAGDAVQGTERIFARQRLHHYAEIDGRGIATRVWVSPHDAGHPDVRSEAGASARWVYVEEAVEVGDRLAVDDEGCATVVRNAHTDAPQRC